MVGFFNPSPENVCVNFPRPLRWPQRNIYRTGGSTAPTAKLAGVNGKTRVYVTVHTWAAMLGESTLETIAFDMILGGLSR